MKKAKSQGAASSSGPPSLFEDSSHDLLSSKTSPVYFLQIGEQISEESSFDWPKSGTVLRHGSHWIPNSLALPREGAECSGFPRVTLSQILQKDAPSKYWLSKKACAGILRRAAKRGKSLPPQLEQAFLSGAGLEKPPEPTGTTSRRIPTRRTGSFKSISHTDTGPSHKACGSTWSGGYFRWKRKRVRGRI